MNDLPSLDLAFEQTQKPTPTVKAEDRHFESQVDGSVPLMVRSVVRPLATQPESNSILSNPLLLSILPLLILYLMAIVYLRKSVMYSYEKALWSIIVILFPVIGPIFLLAIQPKTPGAYVTTSKST
jgi:hypothetical protein